VGDKRRAGKNPARLFIGSTRVSRVVSGVAPETHGVNCQPHCPLKKITVSRAIRRDAELNPRDAGATDAFHRRAWADNYIDWPRRSGKFRV
jgi:hypothetical protein